VGVECVAVNIKHFLTTERNKYMIDKSEFYTILSHVVATSMPSEQDVFDMEGRKLVEEIYAGQDIGLGRSERAYFGFGPEGTKVALEIIPLVIQVYKILKDVSDEVKRNKRTNHDDIRFRLENELLSSGLSVKIAHDIASKVDVAKLG